MLEAAKDAVSADGGPLSADVLMEVFHFMMQEYVMPADAARKLGELVKETDEMEEYQFTGYLKGNPTLRTDVFHEGSR